MALVRVGSSTSSTRLNTSVGLISRELVAHCKSIVGVDISEGMVNQYNLRTHNQGLTPEEMKAVCIELKGTDDELDRAKFDVIVVRVDLLHPHRRHARLT